MHLVPYAEGLSTCVGEGLNIGLSHFLRPVMGTRWSGGTYWTLSQYESTILTRVGGQHDPVGCVHVNPWGQPDLSITIEVAYKRMT